MYSRVVSQFKDNTGTYTPNGVSTVVLTGVSLGTGARSRKALVIVVGKNNVWDSSAIHDNDVTLGGVTMNVAERYTPDTTGESFDTDVALFYLDESEIPAGATADVALNMISGGGTMHVLFQLEEYAAQGAILTASFSAVDDAANLALSLTAAIAQSHLYIASVVHDAAGLPSSIPGTHPIYNSTTDGVRVDSIKQDAVGAWSGTLTPNSVAQMASLVFAIAPEATRLAQSSLVLNNPNAKVDITGHPIVDVYHEITYGEIDNGGASIIPGRNVLMYDARHAGGTGFLSAGRFIITLSDIIGSNNASITVNDISVTTKTALYTLTDTDVIKITINAAGHAGTVRMFADQNNNEVFGISIAKWQIKRSSDDVVLHDLDVANVDLETGIIPDTEGSGLVATVAAQGVRFDPAVINSLTVTQLGLASQAIVSDSERLTGLTIDGVAATGVSAASRTRLDLTLPLDGVDLSGNVPVVLQETSRYDINAITGLYSPYDKGDVFFTPVANTVLNGTLPRDQAANAESVYEVLGLLGRHRLKTVSGTVTYNNNSLIASAAAQMSTNFEIDPNATGRGMTMFALIKYQGTIGGGGNSPDIVWGDNHSDPNILIDDTTDRISFELTDNAADNVLLADTTNDNLPHALIWTYDQATDTLKTFLDTVEKSSATPTGSVGISTDLMFLVGDRLGTEVDGWAFGFVDRALTQAEINVLVPALKTGILDNGSNPIPWYVTLNSGASTWNYFDPSDTSKLNGGSIVSGDTISTFNGSNGGALLTSLATKWYNTNLFHDTTRGRLYYAEPSPIGYTQSFYFYTAFVYTGSSTGSSIAISASDSTALFNIVIRFEASTGALDVELDSGTHFITAALNDGLEHTIGIEFNQSTSTSYVVVDDVVVLTRNQTGSETGVYSVGGVQVFPGIFNSAELDIGGVIYGNKALSAAERTEIDTELKAALVIGGP